MHTSVLLKESVIGLNIKDGDIVVDGTVGAGGHSSSICQHSSNISLYCFDLDTDALERSKKKIEKEGCTPEMINANFSSIEHELQKRNIAHVDRILLDLGISSDQLETSGRGFAFKLDEPLVMTMKANPTEEDLTAYEVVNTWAEESLSDIIFGFGDEIYSRRIARAIVSHRKESPIKTTKELADLIASVVPKAYRNSKINPATKTFQAIRIAVNNELGSLEKGIENAIELLNKEGRLAIITFHSIEDRIVKRAFLEYERQGIGRRITKKPIAPTEEEVRSNPRSRSAKLRIIEKII